MKVLYKDLIYLLSCAVNGITPDTAKVQAMDLERLYRLAKFHTVRGAVCIALKRAGVQDKHFDQAYKKAVRKNIYLDMERLAIISDFEKQGIWYMPLKGSVLKDLYPENGMREMADNDMLYDADKQQKVMEIMLGHGYTAESVGVSHHDVYMKPPVLNFELHTALFSSAHAEPLYRYYADIKRLLIKDDGKNYGYHFSDEDFYIFMTAHEWKHYNGSGTGIRSLLDCYVYCKVKGDALDWDYITEQCKQLEIADFEQERRRLALKVFSSDTLPDLSDSEAELLMYYLTAGTYGTFDNAIKKKLKDQSKLSFWVHSIFIPRKQMAASVPFTAKSPLLYPVGIFGRTFRVMLFKQDKIKQTIKAVKKYGK
ncbi:MAG TPA: nucleotidyltransferase family protein [Ruminococcus sp.]|nr:nucleotidyltransferase family protein [Ruminococcus sp.]